MDFHGYHLFSILWMHCLHAMPMGATVIGPTDYCLLDTFEPKCNKGDIVVIESALYGRMIPGKCITQQEGNFGCFADVRNIVDTHCSGKQHCTLSPLNSKDIVDTKPCPGSGTIAIGYITVAYKCLPALNIERQCDSSNTLKITEDNGIIAAPISTSQNCPILIRAPTGRLIKFSVHNFMKSKSRSACYEVAVLKEKDNRKSVHVCPSDARVKEVYTSSGNDVVIELTNLHIGSGGDGKGSYMLEFTVDGCPKPEIPANSHVERDGDTAKIKCNDSDNSWFIYCKDNKWTDHPRKCPKDWGISKIFATEKSEFPYGIFLTSFIAVGIGIFLGGFLLFIAINAFQRHQRRLRQAYEPPIIPDPDYKIYDTCKMDLNFVPGFGTAGRHTIARHQMSPPPIPSQPPEDERRFSRHTYEKPKYNSTDNSPFVEA